VTPEEQATINTIQTAGMSLVNGASLLGVIPALLSYELAARTLRLGIDSSRRPSDKERLLRMSALMQSFFSGVQEDVEKSIGQIVAGEAEVALEAEEGLRSIDTQVDGSDDEHPVAWETGYTDARNSAVDSLRFRFDLPQSTKTWDDVLRELALRIRK